MVMPFVKVLKPLKSILLQPIFAVAEFNGSKEEHA
jgi:hypothetical protein